VTRLGTMDPQAVLDFWFGSPGDAGYGQPRPEWFRKDDAFDAQIAQRFGSTVEAALSGQLDGWAAEPAPALARVIVLDQFTRNTFRNTARAFAGDAQALAAAQRMVRDGWDRTLLPVQRSFVYLPFEHAEDLGLQQQALCLFGQLAEDDPASAGLVQWAQKHHDVVLRFGRFPHRNVWLGRASTDEELRFLSEPGSGF
jgi:uncharacterized protein (DUF924 family)